MVDQDCQRQVSGESCLAGLCGVVCDPTFPSGGCEPAGMLGGTCVQVAHTSVCGYLMDHGTTSAAALDTSGT